MNLDNNQMGGTGCIGILFLLLVLVVIGWVVCVAAIAVAVVYGIAVLLVKFATRNNMQD